MIERVREVLGELEGGGDGREILEKVLEVISERSGCESVGIRWRAEEDYPYYLTRGFGREFVVREGPLCSRDSAGMTLRHADGTPQLACMCGAVIQGRVGAAHSYFSRGGSFWTSGTTELLRSSPPSAAGTQTRNYCNQVGYESVALIPLRARGEIWGLLQLNSRTPNRFTEELIAEYEGVAKEIAEAAADVIGELGR